MRNLTHDAQLFNEYHALLINLGKNVCRRQPICQQCCLNDLCQYHS
jgi:endonuclease-3 related protein